MMIKSPQTEIWDRNNRLIATYPDFRYGTKPGRVVTKEHGAGHLTVMTSGIAAEVRQVKISLD